MIRLDALTGLRFLAALGVAMAHLPYLHFDPTLSRTTRRILAEGAVGVPFFFVLSGFVLAYAYHTRLATLNRTNLTSYYGSRIRRVWPVHLLTLLVVIWLPVGPQPGGVGPFLANLFLVHTWVPKLTYIQSYNSVSWTLSIEAFFYLVLPILLSIAARRSAASPFKLRQLALGIWLCTVCYVYAVSKMGTPTLLHLYATQISPLPRLGEFTIGVLLGLAFVREGRQTESRWRRNQWTWIEGLAIAGLILLMAKSNKVSPFLQGNGYYTPIVAMIVMVFARQRGYVSSFLVSRPMVYLGDISFAFFMVHPILFIYVGDRYFTEYGNYIRAIVSLCAALAAAAIVHACYEAPLRNLGAKDRTKPNPIPL